MKLMRHSFSPRLLFSGAVLTVAAAFILGATFAVFSDTETSSANVFESGAVDLKVGNDSYYNGSASASTTWAIKDLNNGELFFNFLDIKPDDEGEDTISLRVDTNDAWACMDMNITQNDGLLGDLLNFAFWTDDGDNVYETNENIITSGTADTVLDSEIVLADSIENNVGGVNGDPLTGLTTYHIAKAWCFGTLTPNPVPAGTGVNPIVATGFTCNGESLDNASQGDTLKADILFSAVQSRNNPNFTCEPAPSPSPSMSPTPTPIPFACTSVDNIFASSSSDNDQGLRKNGTAVLANRSIPGAAYGAPQSAGLPVDAAVPAGSFFSLGFPLGGNTASIVYGFSESFFNGPGDDFQIYEVTGATNPPYGDEIVRVEVGPTSVGPWTLVSASAARDETIDIAPMTSAQFIRLTDITPSAAFEPEADAYDLDAIRAFCTQVNN